MNKLFRWSGLIGFVVTVAALAAFWYLLAGTLIKHGIEYVGSQTVGAEVDLASAGVGIAPLQLRLTHLQVTDPGQLSQNMVEFQHAVASLDFWKLLMGQVVINEMSVDGLKFDTPREHPGALKRKSAESGKKGGPSVREKAAKALESAGVELPSIDEILKKEPLLITQRSDELKSTYAEEKAKLEVLQASIPDDKKRQAYQQRIKALTDSKPKTLEEYNQRKQELDQIKKELNQAKKSLNDSKQQVLQGKQTLQQKLSQLKAAPGEDWRRLSSKYSLSQGGALNLSGLLFGNKVQSWSAKALHWYGIVKPYLGNMTQSTEEQSKPARASGRYIRFPSNNPTPDFLIRKASLQIALPFGDVDGVLRDVTPDPQILGRPATLKIDASKLKGADRLLVDGTFDHIKPEQPQDVLTMQLKALQLDKVKLVSKESFPMSLAHAVSNLSGKVTLRGNAIDANFNGQFQQARFSTEAREGLAGEIAKAIAAIDTFNIDGGITGTLGAPRLSLSSDLDKRLNQQLQQRLRAKQTEFEQKLRTALEERIAGPQGEYAGKLSDWQSVQNEVQAQIDDYDKMLKAKISSVQEKAKSDAEQKAKESLKKGLEGLKF